MIRSERERERESQKKIYGILGTFRYVELSPLLTELPPKPHKHWEALRAEGTGNPLRPEGRREREGERVAILAQAILAQVSGNGGPPPCPPGLEPHADAVSQTRSPLSLSSSHASRPWGKRTARCAR